jgi:signal transduction histidine kinase
VRRITSLRVARVADLAIAIGLLALAVVEVWVTPVFGGRLDGPRWLNTMFLVALTLPAVWRRTRPEAAFAVFAVAWTTYLLALYPRQVNAPGETWFMMLLAWFSLGLYGRGRRAALAGALGAVGFAAVMARQLQAGVSVSEVLSEWIFPFGAWALGRMLQRRDLLARALRDRAAELERRQAEEAARAVADERARIARELHDVISHSVSVIVMQAAVEQRLLGDEQARFREALQGIEQAGRDALAELRTLLGVLSADGDQVGLAPQPGLAQVDALVRSVRAAGLPVELRMEGEPVPLPPGLELAVYRVVQEGLTNVLKHAAAAHATVVVRFDGGHLDIEVRDDGRGPNGRGPTSGRGLLGLGERVSLYGGKLEMVAPQPGGFVLHSRIPLDGHR